MRVLQLMASNKRGGAELFFTRLCASLAEAGIEQTIAVRHNAACIAELRASGAPTPVEFPFLSNFDLYSKWRLDRLIARERPRIVLSWMSRAAELCPDGPFIHVARLGGYYDLRHYRRCDHLIGNTQDIVDYLVSNGWPREKAHYLPNFVDERTAVPVDRQSLDTPQDAPVVLALGRLHPDKAFDVLIEAMAQLPNAYLWLAGDGPLKEQLQQLARDCGVAPRVRFLGWRRDSGALLAAATCLACPSRVEPLGNVVLEAWAAGKPVVAAAAAGPASLIHNNKTGLLAPVDDVAALAMALHRVVDDAGLAQYLGEQGRADYRARFGREAVTAQYIRFFESVAA